jgi:hypothetical protein
MAGYLEENISELSAEGLELILTWEGSPQGRLD